MLYLHYVCVRSSQYLNTIQIGISELKFDLIHKEDLQVLKILFFRMYTILYLLITRMRKMFKRLENTYRFKKRINKTFFSFFQDITYLVVQRYYGLFQSGIHSTLFAALAYPHNLDLDNLDLFQCCF